MVGTPKFSIYEYYIRGQKTVAGEKTSGSVVWRGDVPEPSAGGISTNPLS